MQFIKSRINAGLCFTVPCEVVCRNGVLQNEVRLGLDMSRGGTEQYSPVPPKAWNKPAKWNARKRQGQSLDRSCTGGKYALRLLL